MDHIDLVIVRPPTGEGKQPTVESVQHLVMALPRLVPLCAEMAGRLQRMEEKDLITHRPAHGAGKPVGATGAGTACRGAEAQGHLWAGVRLPLQMQKWRTVAIMLAASLGGSAHGALGDCEELLVRIERILTRVKLTPRDAQRVRDLKNEGIRLHRAGRYPECMTPLQQAAALLGLKQEPQP